MDSENPGLLFQCCRFALSFNGQHDRRNDGQNESRNTGHPSKLPLKLADFIMNSMKLQVDKFGRIALPKAVRTRLGFCTGTVLEVAESADGLLLRRVEQRPSLVQKDGIVVHTGRAPKGFDWELWNNQLEQERMWDLIVP